ncbi:DUF7114 family protein [Halalkalirubrum salinum]|uniref:DUF7114 family protein n=1 Tax=Halalkalirubrum salinum TaxID=2563889 RepID=UPI0010FB753B|nr:hypothetical protein [Halalkalirubrum salinum]
MDDAVATRAAATEAIADIEPPRLREILEARLTETSMTPGVLTLASARSMNPSVDARGLTEQAAGVQLIYEGLRLTRTLAHDEPWLPEGTDAENLTPDMEILAADVLVSRGFYLLARTDAATAAVETVRSFGRDQTRRRDPGVDVDRLDRNLEADVFELAVIAGSTAAGGEAPQELRSFVSELARGYDGDSLPPAGETVTNVTTDRLASLTDTRVPSSATDG